MACFAVGLIALALVGGRLIHGTWASGGGARLGGMLAGAGLLTFLPQFFTPGPVRIVHGLVLSAGLALLALAPDPAGASAPSQSRSRMKSIAPVSREMSSGSTAGNIAIRN